MENIIIKGITFNPYKWEFEVDGKWGHISFLVKKGTFSYGTSDGAYCLELNSKEIESISYYYNFDYAIDLVYMATPCMEDEKGLHKYTLEEILNMAAQDIYWNLKERFIKQS